MTDIQNKISILFMAAIATGSCMPREQEQPSAQPPVASLRDFSHCFEAAVRDRKLSGADARLDRISGAEEEGKTSLTWTKVNWSDTEGFSGTQSPRALQSVTVETNSITTERNSTTAEIVSVIDLPEFSIKRMSVEPPPALRQDVSSTAAMVQHSDYINMVRRCAL